MSECWGHMAAGFRGQVLGHLVLTVWCQLNSFVVRDCFEQEKLAGSHVCSCCVECKKTPCCVQCKLCNYGVVVPLWQVLPFLRTPAPSQCLKLDGRHSCGRDGRLSLNNFDVLFAPLQPSIHGCSGSTLHGSTSL